MKRIFAWMVLSGVIGLVAVSGSAVVAADGGDDVSDIMSKLHNKKKGIHPALGKSLKGDIDWATVEKPAAEYLKLAQKLETTTAEKGTKESWAKLTKMYTADAKILADGVAKKDAAMATAGFAGLSKSCQECHDVHK